MTPDDTGSGPSMEFPVLLGDIGGTNARFAVLPSADAAQVALPSLKTSDHATFDEAVGGVLAFCSLRPRSALLAIAGPVTGDEVPLTNSSWVIRPQRLREASEIADVVLLNDFEAQALAVTVPDPNALVPIGPALPSRDGCRVVLGPGTGLGVAGLVPVNGIWVPVPGEGGHVDMGPRTAREEEIWPHIERLSGRVSAEQILCGRGLVNLYRAVCAADGRTAGLERPGDITAAALAGSDVAAVEALSVFTVCLGRLAGDLALIFMAYGGVYLSGGITGHILPMLTDGRFRAAFDDKAPHGELMRQIPVFAVTDPAAPLAGLAAFARAPHRFGVDTSRRRWRF